MRIPLFRSLIMIFLAGLTSLASGSEISASQKHPGKPLRILAIGDSNGALPDGWVVQLKKLHPNDSILNISISGNTIGFINNGRKSLNTLANIGSYMDKAWSQLGKIDVILFMIGTNDCKAVFRDSLQLVPGNMRKIIDFVKQSSQQHKSSPSICIVSPPPFGPDELIGEKYAGGLDRITRLNSMLQQLAAEEGIFYIDTFHILAPVFKTLTVDGVHLNGDGQMIIARVIQENLKYIAKQK
jgi:lysophospholipase L1-like esterase